MKCARCGFDMTANKIDVGITIWKCPLDHKFTEITERPSARRPSRRQRLTESTYPFNLEHK